MSNFTLKNSWCKLHVECSQKKLEYIFIFYPKIHLTQNNKIMGFEKERHRTTCGHVTLCGEMGKQNFHKQPNNALLLDVYVEFTCQATRPFCFLHHVYGFSSCIFNYLEQEQWGIPIQSKGLQWFIIIIIIYHQILKYLVFSSILTIWVNYKNI